MASLRVWIVAGIIVAFCAGLAAGRLAFVPGEPAETPYLQRLSTDYDLRPDQVERARAILEQEGLAIDAVLRTADAQVRDGVAAAREAAEAQIRAVMDDAQRAKFDADMDRQAAGG
jgi:hypothetical protein